MFPNIFHFVTKSRLVRLGGLAMVLVSLGLSGCASWNMRGDRFADNDLADTARSARPKGENTEFWGFSNKARQIEEDCGVGPETSK
jgi:hypothetical protein